MLLEWTVIALGVLAGLQILCSGPVLNRILRRLLRRWFHLDWQGLGLFLPLLYFSAKRVRFMIQGRSDSDRVYFEARRIRCRIDPIFLLMGRIRLIGLRVDAPLLHYFNRLESYKKNYLLPGRHRLEIKNFSIRDGSILVLDETMTPNYRITLGEIQLDNADMDVGTPIDVLFRAEHGQARIDSGYLEIGRHGDEGTLKMWGVTWGEIAGLGADVPFMSRQLALHATHTGGAHGRKAQGVIGTAEAGTPVKEFFSMSDVDARLSFDFEINWDDYSLTFDLGLLRLIAKILDSASAQDISSRGALPGLRAMFEILKKQEREAEE